jgi:NAD(P)-dependent dehydrogenase (short-subunit alcohol dehydrogenase family)
MTSENKVAIITGGASGIGEAISRRFARDGIIPVIADINLEAANALADELSATAMKVDVRSYDECKAAAEKVYAEYGHIDILVNCAGGNPGRILKQRGNFSDTPISRVDFGIQLNLMGAIYMTHSVINYMIESTYGKIINIGSVAGVVGAAGSCDYAAAKGGLISFTKSLSMEVGQYGINVTCVSPGPILTHSEMASGNTFLGRVGKPEEVASLVAYLVSDEAGFITGHNYIIDGGRCNGGLPWGSKP